MTIKKQDHISIVQRKSRFFKLNLRTLRKYTKSLMFRPNF